MRVFYKLQCSLRYIVMNFKLINKFKRNLHLMNIVHKSISTLYLRALGLLLSYILTMYITNYYGAQVFGSLSLLIVIVTIFSIIPQFGMQISLVRIVSDLFIRPNRYEYMYLIKRVTSIVLILSVSSSLLLALICNIAF